MRLSDRSVVFVTLDSCRYDTARCAATPNLDRLGPLLRAETSGTYTLPAHAAFFTGDIPRPVSGGGYPVGGTRWAAVWRSAAARPTAAAVGVELAAGTLMAHYRAAGHAVIGAGGVTFFDPAEPCNTMPRLFDEFHYVGRPNRDPAVRAGRVSDRNETLTLSHVADLGAICRKHSRFFLFVNCASTHVPYTTPRTPLTIEATKLLWRLYALHDSKRCDPAAFTAKEISILRHLQRHAVEWADERIGALLTVLADRAPLVVVCADHGEEFGDDGRYGHGHPHPSVTTVPLWCGLLDGSR